MMGGLRRQLNQLAVGVILAVSLFISLAAVAAMDRLAHQLNEARMLSELGWIQSQVDDTHRILKDTGVDTLTSYLDSAQQEIIQKFHNFRIGDTGRLYLVSDDGRVVSAPSDRQATDLDGAALELVIRENAGHAKLMIAGSPSLVYFDTFPEWRWRILLVISEKEINAARDKFLLMALLILLFSACAGVFVFARFANGFVQPILELAEKLSGMNEDQLGQPLEVKHRSKEVGILLRAFSRLSDRLLAAKNTLQEQNEELQAREGELLRQNDELISAEAMLQQSEHRHRSILQTAMDGILFLDTEGRFVEVNETYCRMSGYSMHELLSMSVSDVDCIETASETAAHIKKTMEQGEDRFESQHRRKDGTIYDVEVSVQYRPADGGQFVVFVQDITERKQAEQALRESEERFHQLFEKAPLGYQSLDSDGRFVEVNLAWLETLGYKREEVIGKWFGDFLAPEYVQAFRERFPIFKAEGKIHSEFFMMHKDGSRRYICFDGRVGHHADGNFKQTHCILRDETERKRAEEKLRRSEKDLRESQRIAHVGNWRLDVATNQVVWTEELYKMYGLDPSLSPPPYTEHMKLFTRESWERLSTAMARTRDTGIPYTLELETVREDGSNGWMWVRGEADLDSTGKTVELWGAVQDITERKQAETYREMGREILQILNDPGDMKESIRRILERFKTWTGVDAVGLRLQEGEDFPYFAHYGFSEDFLQTGNTLLEYSKDGGVLRDEDGNVCLECMCGLVISGKTDASSPLFTNGGSFWTNNSISLLDLPAVQGGMNTRNNCIHSGYVSVALIPVRTRDRIVGLIQLNDKSQDRFTLEKIEMLEDIAAHVGSALLRRRGEEELRESEEKFRSFVENVNDIIFSLTKEGILSYVSPNWLFFMGEPDEDAIGRVFQQYIHPDDVPLFCDYLSLIDLQWDKKTSVEYRIRHRDGTWLWHTSNASALRSQDGASLGYLGVARDITEKKKMQDFMVQTEKIMSLGTMAAGMAHEINNPLGIISQGVQNVLRRTRDDLPGNHKAAQETGISLEPLQQYLEKRNVYRSLEAILDAVKRSSDIVSNMLQFSRRSDLFPVDCDINQILEKSITLAATDYDLKKKYDFRNIRILKEFSLTTELPCICSEMEQVFLNMLRNSAQSFEKVERNEPTIILRTWEDPETNWAFVEIEDNGSGIEDQILKNIFDPFFTTKRVGEGTGLGLAVSHHIVTQRHQGRIIAESKVGHWTRLRIQLPLRSSFENAPAGNHLQTQ